MSKNIIDLNFLYKRHADLLLTKIPVHIGNGWVPLVTSMLDNIVRSFTEEKIELPKISRIYSNLGELTVNFSTPIQPSENWAKSIHSFIEWVDVTKEVAYKTCEICGAEGELRKMGDVVGVVCNTHDLTKNAKEAA